MTTAILTEQGRLTALRAAWLFDGTSSSMIRDPVVVIDGATIIAVDSVVSAPEGAAVVDLAGAALLPEVVARIPGMVANTRRLYEAGAQMVAGTDAGIAPAKPHDVVRYALAMLGELGFGPAEALRAITSVAAGVCGLGHRKGRIAPGFDADILAVDGDPITDQGSLHRIRAVYARGTAVPDAAAARFPG